MICNLRQNLRQNPVRDKIQSETNSVQDKIQFETNFFVGKKCLQKKKKKIVLDFALD